MIAGARAFDQRIQREHPQRAGDLLNLGDLSGGGVAHEVGAGDCVGDDLGELCAFGFGMGRCVREAHVFEFR